MKRPINFCAPLDVFFHCEVERARGESEQERGQRKDKERRVIESERKRELDRKRATEKIENRKKREENERERCFKHNTS